MKVAKSMKAATKDMLASEEAESRAFRNELDESRKELAEMARGSSIRDADYNTMKANVESLRGIARQSQADVRQEMNVAQERLEQLRVRSDEVGALREEMLSHSSTLAPQLANASSRFNACVQERETG